jgi:hypothetical protein
MSNRIENGVKLGRLRARYKLSSPKKKTIILNELCDLHGMNRKYLIRLLNGRHSRPKRRKGPKLTYIPKLILPPLKVIWFASDQLCSKKLKAILPLWLPFYEQHYGRLDPDIRSKLLSISPASIDRILHAVKLSSRKRRRCGTKPGSLIKNQIPIRMNQWDERNPGFIEADTVAHCGNSLQGDFAWSLTMTDIHTTWTENRAVWNKGSGGVVKQIEAVEACLPFPIKGFDCDNGSEFLNYHLIRYFSDRPKQKLVQFTRSRPYHKNDNAHVEQKNWTHVRQLFGYDRFDQYQAVELMNDLYSNEWSLYQNHFIPTMKCIEKIRLNSSYKKRFDLPKTPYERVLSCDQITEETKRKLQLIHQNLDPFELKIKIEKKLRQIFKYVTVSENVRKRI